MLGQAGQRALSKSSTKVSSLQTIIHSCCRAGGRGGRSGNAAGARLGSMHFNKSTAVSFLYSDLSTFLLQGQGRRRTRRRRCWPEGTYTCVAARLEASTATSAEPHNHFGVGPGEEADEAEMLLGLSAKPGELVPVQSGRVDERGCWAPDWRRGQTRRIVIHKSGAKKYYVVAGS